ncbi:hypothetical protein WICPIJ_005339 [Wickerhamomyces pijperi]|uniref:Uncharacterized protein n=1 Tax=Wickerhamomyces pijperi TaxID=599730 RepID=A0A9P8Q5U1_WICPI|nr:hypothetical protein WICPIJ_005339 [Wickerhamomyces pijperi]
MDALASLVQLELELEIGTVEELKFVMVVHPTAPGAGAYGLTGAGCWKAGEGAYWLVGGVGSCGYGEEDGACWPVGAYGFLGGADATTGGWLAAGVTLLSCGDCVGA